MSQDSWLSTVNFSSDGLVPVVAQERRSGAVLMVAYANREALERTAATGRAHYYSRSRQSLWQKGESSGHEQYVDEIRLDCDRDTVLYRVRQVGPACHTGTDTCFSTTIADGQAVAAPDRAPHVLERLAGLIATRAADRPEKSYTVALLNAGIAKVSQKVGEEAVEVVVAANAEDEGRLASESADLLYHLLVLLQVRGVPLARVWEELENRSK